MRVDLAIPSAYPVSTWSDSSQARRPGRGRRPRRRSPSPGADRTACRSARTCRPSLGLGREHDPRAPEPELAAGRGRWPIRVAGRGGRRPARARPRWRNAVHDIDGVGDPRPAQPTYCRFTPTVAVPFFSAGLVQDRDRVTSRCPQTKPRTAASRPSCPLRAFPAGAASCPVSHRPHARRSSSSSYAGRSSTPASSSPGLAAPTCGNISPSSPSAHRMTTDRLGLYHDGSSHAPSSCASQLKIIGRLSCNYDRCLPLRSRSTTAVTRHPHRFGAGFYWYLHGGRYWPILQPKCAAQCATSPPPQVARARCTATAKPRTSTAATNPPAESDDQVQQLVDDYLDGSTVYQLGERFGVSRQTVSRLLKRHGVTMRMACMSQEQIDEAARLYEAGQSLARIGAHLGFNDTTVRSRLIERGVKMRPRQGEAEQTSRG